MHIIAEEAATALTTLRTERTARKSRGLADPPRLERLVRSPSFDRAFFSVIPTR